MTAWSPSQSATWPLRLRLGPPAPTKAAATETDEGVRTKLGVEDLYGRYADDVFGLSLWILGCRDEASDVVQDTFVRLLTWKRPLEEIRKPRALLLRIARTAALDRIRSRKPTEALAEETLLASPHQNPESEARAREISTALSALPAKQREAIYLRFFMGLTFAEIGRVTRVPTFTAASRCRLGIGKLQTRMGEP